MPVCVPVYVPVCVLVCVPVCFQTEKVKLFKAPEKASSVMEALEQRLIKYKESEDQAKQEQNSSKAKRMGRIVKVLNNISFFISAWFTVSLVWNYK